MLQVIKQTEIASNRRSQLLTFSYARKIIIITFSNLLPCSFSLVWMMFQNHRFIYQTEA